MPSSYSIVSYQPEFKDGVIQLQTQLWSPSKSLNRAYFDWKFEKNPYVSQPLVYLALHDRKVVGMRGFHGLRLEAGSPREYLMGLYADDLVIDREHRDRGLIPRIMEAAFEDLSRRGYEYIFNFSAGPITLMSSLSLGWRSAGSMGPLRRESWAGNDGRVHRFTRVDESYSPVLRAAGPQSVPDWSAHRFEHAPSVTFALKPRLDDMSKLIERIGDDGRIRHVRDRDYLTWRFQNPLSRYGFLFCGEERLDGYMVLHEYTSEPCDTSLLNIVDWEAASPPVLNELLRAACDTAGSHKLLSAWSVTQSAEKMTLLAQSGFHRVQNQDGPARHLPPLLVRSLAMDHPPAEWKFARHWLIDQGDWDVRMLYSMHG